ncbi:Rho GTPase activation protein [Lactarius tabidus]
MAVAEANAQQAFVDVLDTGVISPLATFKTNRKETTKRTRTRIEGDLKISAAKYADHAENRISKLQAAYFKKYHPLFRGQQDGSEEPERAKSKDVSDNDFRSAVCLLNALRSIRAENLQDGYNCLEEIVFAPIAKTVIVQYMDGMITTSAKYDTLAISTRVEVEKVLARKDTSESNLRASFRRALSFSIPPPTFYRNYCPGAHSDLILGVPLVDLETNPDNVSKVMRICMEEIEKRGLDTKRIYLLRQRLESEKSFSFRSTDNIHSVAMLLMQYLYDLPKPLFVLSLQDSRNYKQIRAKYPENDFLLLRTKIRELHPVHRASLGALLRHLLRVASYSDMNAMSVEELADKFRFAVLRGYDVLQDGVHIKSLVLEDLIRNVHTLFDDQPSKSPPVPSPAAETTSTFPSGSLLGAELSQLSEVDVMGPNAQRLGPVGVTPSLTQSSFSSLSLANSPPEDVSVPPTSVTEWRLRQLQLPLQSEAVTTPQSPPESVLSSLSDLALSSVMSL